MLEPRPTRRDPRLLVIDARRGRLSYAALDAWEVCALGILPALPRALRLATARLLLQVRPSAVVMVRVPRPLALVVTEQAHLRGLPCLALDADALHALDRDTPTMSSIREEYPELRMTPIRGHVPTLRLTSALLAERAFSSRRYVSRLAPHPAPGLDP